MFDCMSDWQIGMSNISVADDAMAGVKKELRKHISTALKAIENAEIERQSQRLAESICALPEFRDAKALSVYLEMPKEAATRALLEAAFAANKRVYVPKITGRGAEDLKMVHALSLEDIDGFPKVRSTWLTTQDAVCDVDRTLTSTVIQQDKWRIPDPPLLGGDGTERDDPIKALDLELVLLPGVAFDRSGGRLGHGKGYYGKVQLMLSSSAIYHVLFLLKAKFSICRLVPAPPQRRVRRKGQAAANDNRKNSIEGRENIRQRENPEALTTLLLTVDNVCRVFACPRSSWTKCRCLRTTACSTSSSRPSKCFA